MKVTAAYAQQHLAELLETAGHGEEIEIARDGKPSAKLTRCPIACTTKAQRKAHPRRRRTGRPR